MLRLYEALTGASQAAEIAAALQAAEIVETKDAARNAEKAADWQTARRMYTKLRDLTGSRAYDSKIRSSEAKENTEIAAARYRKLAGEMSKGTDVVPGFHFSVTSSQFRKCLAYECGQGDWKYLLLAVKVENHLGQTWHVNPHHFTITSCGEDSPHDSATYSLDDPLPAVDLRSGSYARGWIAFFVNQNCQHALNYAPASDASATLRVAAPP